MEEQSKRKKGGALVQMTFKNHFPPVIETSITGTFSLVTFRWDFFLQATTAGSAASGAPGSFCLAENCALFGSFLGHRWSRGSSSWVIFGFLPKKRTDVLLASQMMYYDLFSKKIVSTEARRKNSKLFVNFVLLCPGCLHFLRNEKILTFQPTGREASNGQRSTRDTRDSARGGAGRQRSKAGGTFCLYACPVLVGCWLLVALLMMTTTMTAWFRILFVFSFLFSLFSCLFFFTGLGHTKNIYKYTPFSGMDGVLAKAISSKQKPEQEKDRTCGQ